MTIERLDYIRAHPHWHDPELLDAYDTTREQLAQARKDTERLDWLERNLALQISAVKLDKDLTQIGVEIIFGASGTMAEDDTLREAIDLARAKQEGAGESPARTSKEGE